MITTELGKMGRNRITVSEAAASAVNCPENGGKALVGPRSKDGGRFTVIEDPRGRVAAPCRARED